MSNLVCVAFAIMALLGGGTALAQDQLADAPSQLPILQIDAGMHTASIRRVGADAACSFLATGSEDKTIRLWRLSDGRLLNTLRVPIGDGREGKIYAVAVAPDGGWIAAGGFTKTGGQHRVYIFQAATGEMTATFGPFPQAILNLAISPDGKRLAATYWRGGGVRVWDRQGVGLASWQQAGEDRFYGGQDANGAVFDPNGVLYTVADDGKLRRYADIKSRPKVAPTRGGRRPYSVSINTRDNHLAVGFADTAAVDVYNATTLTWQFAAKADDAGGGAGGFAATAWSASGDQLFAGGTYLKGNQYVIRVWDQAGNGLPRDLEGNSDAIQNLLSCSSGVAVAAGNPAFGLLDAHGERKLWRGPIGADMRNKLGQNFTISRDGGRVRFGLGEGSDEPVVFDLEKQNLADSPTPPNDLFPPETAGLPVQGWQNGISPQLAADRIKLDVNERSQSLAIGPEKQRFVLGSDFFLRAYDQNGGELWAPKQAPGIFWGVNISQDGRLIVAALGDGTIRWYRMRDGRELLALFVQRGSSQAGNRKWVAWTPKGYFMASVRGDDLVGWHVNRDWNQAADFFPLSRFRDTFDRPDIVSRVLATLDEDAAANEANAALDRTRDNEDIKITLPPVINIVSSSSSTPAGASPGTREFTIAYAVRSPSGLPITRVAALVDGKSYPGAAASNLVLDAKQEATGTFKVNVTPRDAVISLTAESNDLRSTPVGLTVREFDQTGLTTVSKGLSSIASGVTARQFDHIWPTTIKPNLYALIVGVGQYDNVGPSLAPIPENDADAIKKEFEGQGGEDGAFAHVSAMVLTELTNPKATLKGIETGLQWLADNAKDPDNDIALFYFSGHGAVMRKSALLLPADFDPKQLATGLSKAHLLELLNNIDGRVIVVIDACHAAAQLQYANILDTRGLANALTDQTRITAFASSQGTQPSGAHSTGTNSYFTNAFIEGMRGKAARQDDRIILPFDMQGWLYRQVTTLTKSAQQPYMASALYGDPPPVAALRQ
jgi:WD40 repeat protein